MRGVPSDEIEKLTTQAFAFGMASLTHASEVVSETLNSMSGATSPKLQLELMCAKVLVPAAADSEVGSLARIDRLERRIGMAGGEAAAAPATATPAKAASAEPAAPVSAPVTAPVNVPTETVAPAQISALTTQNFKDAWVEILANVNKASKSAWMVAFALQVIEFEADGSVLTLKFSNARDLETFKSAGNAPDVLRKAIDEVLGVTVKFKPQFSEAVTAPIAIVAEASEPESSASTEVASVSDDEVSLLEEEAEAPEAKPVAAEKSKSKSRNSKMVDEEARYGESLLREMLGAEPVEDKKNGR
jgi:DNA polymerase-3 subunit gamma/tau